MTEGNHDRTPESCGTRASKHIRRPEAVADGFSFRKIVYVGDLSGEPSYGLRYTQKLVHERHAELVLVHSLDPIVYALPGAELRDGAAKAELTAMEHDPQRHGANHESLVKREQICAEILDEARRHSASLLVLSTAGRTAAAAMAPATMARLLLADTHDFSETQTQ
jgi:hypothetical protein